MYLAPPQTDWLMLIFLLGAFFIKAETNNQVYTDTLSLKAKVSNHIVALDGDSRYFLLNNLEPEGVYRLGLRTGNTPVAKKLKLKLDPTQAEILEETSSTLKFKALQGQLGFTIKNPAKISAQFTLIAEKENIETQFRSPPGIETDPNYTPLELIQDIFIGGSCFEIVPGSIQALGSPQGMGFFSAGASSIGIESGVILASGEIDNAHGPNNNNNTTGWLNGQNDVDLDQVGTGATEDAVGIEFEFVPTTNMVEFIYVFASEEYCQYVNTGFNDVFGFFISGPSISGPHTNNAINIATVPGSNNYVSINTINKFQNSAYYNMNERPLEASGCGYNDDQVAPMEIQYDGFTTPLTAVANVIPCETYKIRLVIADVGDQLLDSGVFLAANSFNASGGIQISAAVPVTGTNQAYEVCDGAYFLFERENDDLSQNHVININIDPESTATEGVDYETLPPSVIIPAGENSFVLPITVLNDNIIEGSENLRLVLDQPCSCDNNSAELIIMDSDPLAVNLQDMSSCIGTVFDVVPEVSGGLPGYTFSWNDGADHTSFQVSPNSDVSYALTVTDLCGNSVIEDVNILINNGPEATMNGNGQLCEGDAGTEFTIDFTGVGPWDLTYAFNGNNVVVNNIEESPYALPVAESGTYFLVDVVSLGCDGNVAANAIELSYTSMQIDFQAMVANCYGGNDAAIDIETTGGNGNYTFAWSNEQVTEDLAGLSAGNYLVTATDEIGCTAVASIEVADGEEIITEILPIQEIDCYGNENAALDITVTGGAGNYNYLWSNTSTLEDQENLGAGDYSLTISDSNGCSEIVAVNIPEPAPLQAEAEALSIANCLNPEGGTIGLEVTGGVGDYNFTWSNGDTTEDIQSLQEGNYIVNITDGNGCITSATATIDGDFDAPVLALEPAEILTCKDSVVNVVAIVENVGSQHDFNWSTTDGNILLFENTASTEVNLPGSYSLLVTDNNNGCTATDVVQVAQNVTAPLAQASAISVINCFDSEVVIDGSASSQGAEITYLWSTTTGQIESGENSDAPIVSVPTAYNLLVTDEESGCTATTEITVNADLVAPVAAIATTPEINCYNNTVLLNAEQSDNGAGLEYFWSTGNGEIVEGETGLTPEVAAEGIYTLTVLNTVNGCVGTTATNVVENYVAPIVDAGMTQELNCYEPELNLNATAQGVGVVYEWKGPDGNLLEESNILNPLIDRPGSYELEVTNMSNGCVTVDVVEITENFLAPFVDAGEGVVLDCATTAFTIDGSASDQGPEYTYEWSTVNGSLGAVNNAVQAFADEPGTYLLTVQNVVNGCIESDSVLLTQNLFVPEIIMPMPAVLNCYESQQTVMANLSETGNYTYGWATNDGNILDGIANEEVLLDAPGNYTFTVFNNENSCETTASVNVSQDITPPVVEAGTANTLTCQETAITLNGGASSSGNNYTYLWTTTEGNFLSGQSEVGPEVNVPGAYTLAVTNMENGCQETDEVLVAQDIVLPDVDAGENGVINCYQPVFTLNGAASSMGTNLTYSWSSPNGAVLNNEDDFVASTEVPGTYNLVVTNQENGCSATTAVLVEQDTDLSPLEILPTSELNCYNPEVQLQALPEISDNLTYSWSSSDGILLPDTALDNVMVNAAGTYTISYQNTENGCADEVSLSIAEDFELPLANAGADTELNCVVTTLMLDGTASSQGDHFLYEWLDPNGEVLPGEIEDVLTVNLPGAYQLLVRNTNNGCITIDEVFVNIDTQYPAAVVANPATLNCEILTVNLDASASDAGTNFTYQWSTEDGQLLSGETTMVASVDAPGNYLLEITNTENQCVTTEPIVVAQNIVNPTIATEIPGIINCQEESVVLNALASSQGNEFDYQWSSGNGIILSGANTPEPEVGQAGNYDLFITNTSNACTATSTVEVFSDTVMPIVDAGVSMELNCYNPTLSLDASASDQGAVFTYSWSSDDGNFVEEPIDLSPQVDQAGTYLLTIVNEQNHCSATDAVLLTENFQPPVAMTVETGLLLNCITTNLQLDASASEPVGQLDFLWATETSGIVSGVETATPTINTPGTYDLLLMDQNNGCTTTTTVAVSEDVAAPVLAIATPDILDCIKNEVAVQANVTEAGSNFSANWTSTDGNIATGENSLTPMVDAAGNYMLEVLNPDNGCATEMQVEVLENRVLPEITIEEPEELNCVTSEVELFTTVNASSQDLSYEWNGANILSPFGAANALVDGAGNYEVKVTDEANGCVAIHSVVVTENTNVPNNLDLIPEEPPCYNGEGQVTIEKVDGGEGPYVYSLDGGESFWPEPVFAELDPGEYEMIVQDAIGCEYAQNFTLPNAQQLALELGTDIEIELGDEYQLNANINFTEFLLESVSWTNAETLSCNDCLDPLAKPVRSTRYEVTVTHVNGCTVSDNVSIILDQERPVFIPNAFSPNNDGNNEGFTIFAKEKQIAKINFLNIFDRWGGMVFENKDFPPNLPDLGWNGIVDGKALNPGVFVYWTEVEFIDGTKQVFKGDVTLVR